MTDGMDFALLGHPSSYEHLSEILLHSRPDYGRERLERYQRTIATMFEWAPSYVSAAELEVGVEGGEQRRGGLVICPFLPGSLASPAGVARAYKKVREGCRLARERGARVVGLGGFTSIVAGGQGERLARELDLAVTSGNSLTAALALEQLDDLLGRLGWDLAHRSVAIVGASGDIGRACAMALAPRAGSMLLVGRSAPKLAAVAQELPGSPSVRVSGAVDDALAADVIITATSAAAPLIEEADLGPGTVVCDISYPRAVRRSRPARRDALVFPGGLAALPFDLDIAYLTRLPGTRVIHGCYAEAITLSLAGRDESFSSGQGRISPERMAEIRELAREVGIGAASPAAGQGTLDALVAARDDSPLAAGTRGT